MNSNGVQGDRRALHVRVSNHFYYNDFGIRDSGEMRYSGRRYVMTGTPGTGFIERESESHSYHQFVRRLLALQKPNYWRMLLGKEPSFARELSLANKALMNASDPRIREMLECYVNALTIGRKQEYMERVVRGIKDKMGHRSNKFMVSVMSHYKNKIRQLENDMESVIWHVKDHCSAETYEAYCEMVEAFTAVWPPAAASGSYNEKTREAATRRCSSTWECSTLSAPRPTCP